MKGKDSEREALYRFQIIAPLINERPARGELKKKIRKIADRIYEHPKRGYEKFAFKTVEEWYYLYKKYGLSGIEKRSRSDQGKIRSVPEEIGELILRMKKENPRRSVKMIQRELILAGKIRPKELSRSAVYRLLSQHNWDQSCSSQEPSKRKYAYPFSNDCWQSDVTHGTYLSLEGSQKKQKIYIYAFIDDASRVIPHAQIFLAENLENFLLLWKTALNKKGIPGRLYLDNASYFRSPVVRIIGARLGIRIIYSTPYSPHTKGKIERWWLSLKNQFLSYLSPHRTYTLENLNRLLLTWIEKEYHHTVHSSLQTTPIEAWQKKAREIRYPNFESIEKDFLHETERKVRRDGTFSLQGVCYEIDSTFAGEILTIRYDTQKMGLVYAYLKDQFLQNCYPVDEVENQKTPRHLNPKHPFPESSGINFIDLLKKQEDQDV
jgi:transposase InsO family protein